MMDSESIWIYTAIQVMVFANKNITVIDARGDVVIPEAASTTPFNTNPNHLKNTGGERE